MRFALSSGVLAGRSLLTGEDYDALWKRELGPHLRTGVINRTLFSLLGNRNYGRFIRRVEAAPDPRSFLRRYYAPSILKRLLTPWARYRFKSRRSEASCSHVDCHCVWCRHGKDHGSQGR